MKIAVWGLGPCGLVNAACLAQAGHEVVGIETNPLSRQAYQAGAWPKGEPDLAALLSAASTNGCFSLQNEADNSLAGAALSLVCVGTPPDEWGGLDTTQVESVIDTLSSLIEPGRYHTVVIRSTMPVGFLRTRALPILARNHRLGVDFGLATLPEFLREGSAIADFREPSPAVVGALDDGTSNLLVELHNDLGIMLRIVRPEEAEMLKLVTNSFRALKIGFANEIGRLCAALALDGAVIMDLICADTRLNMSPAYLRPGMPFGGSCLEKDLTALVQQGKEEATRLPILGAVVDSNRHQVQKALEAIRKGNPKRIGFLGLAFKAGTSDLRNSPAYILAASLAAEGCHIAAHDPNLAADDLAPDSAYLIQQSFGDPPAFLLDLEQFVDTRHDLVLLTQRRLAWQDVVRRLVAQGTKVLDLDDSSFDWLRE